MAQIKKSQTGGTKSKKSKSNKSNKTKSGTKKKMPEGMAWCPSCKCQVTMVNPTKVPMGKTRFRFIATDKHGHKVSRFI